MNTASRFHKDRAEGKIVKAPLGKVRDFLIERDLLMWQYKGALLLFEDLLSKEGEGPTICLALGDEFSEYNSSDHFTLYSRDDDIGENARNGKYDYPFLWKRVDFASEDNDIMDQFRHK